jgi:hypothetical protein
MVEKMTEDAMTDASNVMTFSTERI